jgi:predicted DNA-binding antitoxin AbrB/MazE fold protein
MMRTVRAIVKNGQITLLEPVEIAEGTEVLVTVPTDEEDGEFLMRITEQAFAAIWDNPEDDAHGELLADQKAASVRMPSAVKRGIGTLAAPLVLKKLGRLSPADAQQLDDSLCSWLGL